MPLTYSVPDTVLTSTLAKVAPNVVDQIFAHTPFGFWLVGRHQEGDGGKRGQKETVTGGIAIVQPLRYGKNSTAKAYSGYDILDVTPQEGFTSARFEWKQLADSITISGKEEAMNRGEAAILNLLEEKTSQAKDSLVDLFSQMVLSTNGDSDLGLTGLQNIVSASTTTGGLSGSSYDWWRAKANTSIGSFATYGLDKMRNLYNSCTKGMEHPDLILSDQNVYEYYEKVLQPQERFVDAKTADGGFENLKFKGATYMFDNSGYFPAGTQYMLNSNFLHLKVMEGRDFATTPFQRPENQDARTAQIIFMGELTVSNRQRHGVNSGFTA